jgi:pimeloyl-ACP methyl ester carboxylesterase
MQVLYLHGFASGPGSRKAVAFSEHYGKRGVAVERLDLRVPSFEHLRLSAMIDHVRAAIKGPAIVIGSSLGGLTAARVAERDDRVQAAVLLAPAFELITRWRTQLEAAGEWDDWKRTGWREVYDYSTGESAKIDYGFVEDAERTDVGFPNVKQPVLVLHGLADETVPIVRSREFVKSHPSAKLVEVPDGHELANTIPTLLAESDRFLANWLP